MTVKMLDNMTLEELTETYICNKYGKDPIKCLDCEKYESCPAGKRAIEILNDMTETKKTFKGAKGAMANHLKARERAINVLQHENPMKYLMEEEGLNYNAARERIRKYKKQYPDLFGLPENKKPVKPYRGVTDEERKEDYLEARKMDSPSVFYMNKYGLSYDAAWHRWKDAQKKFSEFVEEDKEAKNMKADEDNMEEISLEEFLNMHSNEETEDDFTEETGNKKGVTIQEATDEKKDAEGDVRAKYEELLRERDELMKKLDWYTKAISSFEMVMDIMCESARKTKEDN